ncbi:MAG TPA: amidohydrolase family protein [Caulobacteraceae bacterium]|nr:amidohydrolase family protein [Caulobacteraceae bacterium]
MRRLSLKAAVAAALFAVAAPAAAETVAVTNARILTMGPAGEIASGTVVIRDGKITAVGPNVSAPAGARVIDAKGAIVTPGFIAADSALGAVEVSALGETNDLNAQSRNFSAAFDVQYGLNPDSMLLPAARLGGITRAVVVPDHPGRRDGHKHDDGYTAGGGHETDAESLFAGQAAVVHLGAGDDMLVKAKVAQLIPLGDAGATVSGGARGATFVALKEALDAVRTYRARRSAYDTGSLRDLGLSRADLEALIPVVEGRQPVILSVHRAADIRNALRFARDEKLKIILDGAEEGWRVADEIARANVPVILNPVSNLPGSFETLGSTMENAARLQQSGVTVIVKGGDSSHRAREMRYNAGNAVAHGLPYQAALAGMTINPARVFGVADRVGSLEPGKEGDLVIWDGDPLEPMSQPVAVFIRGEEQSLMSRGRMLADRYRNPNDAYPPAYKK